MATIFAAGIIISGLLSGGCASIVSKSDWPVTISSEPNEATVSVKNSSGAQIMKTKTPTTLTLKSGDGYFCPAGYIFEFSKDGYETQTIHMNAGLNGWYCGNIFLGGLIGLVIVDPLTGAMYKLPPTVFANLPEKAGEKKKEPAKEETTKDAKDEKTASEKLVELKDLKDKELITPEEYETKRKAVSEKL